ncbi:MAG: tRNA (adenosine(37)-N6)-threonylcarbamoyltransferase complex dimerization subunit type 1 TsaB, partial [Candidatus Rokuibacteriota bacterium]
MRLLALETATLAGGAALLDDGRLVGESRLNIALTHSERLMAVVDRLLQDCGCDARSLDALAVSVGPGSFTGLRVGAATAKGLALALEVEVAPVPTLDALAATLPFANAPVCALLDARKGEVYCSLYRWAGDAMERRWDYLALPPEAAAARLEAPVIVLGDGVAACRPYLSRLGAGVREAEPVHSLP